MSPSGFLAVWLPSFRLDRCGWDPRVPVVLVRVERGAERVLALSPVAAAAGVKPGMTLAHARSMCPPLQVERLDAPGEARDLAELALLLERFSPQVQAHPPDLVLLEASPEALGPVRACLAALGHAARLVWAVEPKAAVLLARHPEAPPGGRDRVLRREDLRAALAPLPIAALGLPDPVLLSLHDVGVRSVGAFAALPPAALGGRYGAAVAALHALARGEEPPASIPMPPPDPDTTLAVELPDPVEQLDALLFVVHGLARDLCAALADLSTAQAGGPEGGALVRVLLRLRLDAPTGGDAGEVVVPVRLGRPGRSPDRLFRVLRARLERVTLPAPVVGVALEVVDVAPFQPGQVTLHDRADAPEPLPDLLARLQDTLGDEVVVRVAGVDTHLPEAAWRAVPVDDDEAPPAAPARPMKDDPAAAHEPLPAPPTRPVLLLPAAVPVRVAAAPSGRPRALFLEAAGRRREAGWVPVVEVEGPERLVGAWWGERAFARDYWRVRIEDGRQAWVFRDTAPGAEGPAAPGAAAGSTATEPAAPATPAAPSSPAAPSRPAAPSSPAAPSDGEGPLAGAASDRWWVHGWFDQEAVEGWAVTAPPGPPPAAPNVLDIRTRQPVRLPRRAPPPTYAELVCRSNFSFCEGASHPSELVERARQLGLDGLAVTDRDGLYGAVQAHRAAKAAGLPLVHGSLLSVRLPDEGEGPAAASVVALVQDHHGWANLCRLLTAARLGGARLDDVLPPPELADLPEEIRARARAADPDPPPAGLLPRRQGVAIEKGWSALPFEALLERSEGLILLARGAWAPEALDRLREAAGDRLYRAVSRRLGPDEVGRIDALARGPVPCVATGDVLMHHRSRQALQDVLTCIRLGTSLPEAGRRLQPNAERVLAAPARFVHRFAAWPELVHRTLEIRARCSFSLDELQYRYPRELTPEGYAPIQWLRELTARGLRARYPQGVPDKVTRMVAHELGIIERLDFASYFLTVADLVRFARERGILCQGRGSAANSAVCYALGVTSVDPSATSLLFERFISEERGEPPDIDVDFEHERREEVLQYAYEKYGRDRAAMVNEVIAWRGRSAVRDVGRALGYDVDQVDRLAKVMGTWGEGELSPDRIREAGFVPGDPMLAHLARLVTEIRGFPRHTSIHVGGFVISDGPLVDLAPVEPARMPGRTVLQWDKNDVDDLGLVKVDLLALGMLTAIRKCFTAVRSFHGVDLDLASVPREDPAVYDMLCAADSIGVFQIESRAQQSMLPRLKPRCFYDLVVETAIVRPGPIQGGMVHPYLRRRNGEEPVEYADARLVPILERTLGVPIFQEQVMAMAVAVGGFTPGEADRLRRAMGAWRKRGGLDELGEKLLAGMTHNGIAPQYAEQILKQIRGFAEYGFPESHAASFAHLVYVSAWLRCHHPAAFCAALLNAQPMGFYAPRSLVADAQRHGVEVRPVDVRFSDWDSTLEGAEAGDRGGGPGVVAALRLGLRQVRGFKEASARRVEEARRDGPFRSLPDLAARTGLGAGDLRLLARADALAGLLGPGEGRGAAAQQLGLFGGGGRPAADRPAANRPTGDRPAIRRPPTPEPPRAGDRVRAAVWAVEGLWPGLFARLPRPDAETALPTASLLDTIQAEYAATGLSVDRHPLQVARARLDREGYTPLARLAQVPTGTTVRIAGLVSHRQRPGTASGVVFMTLEDETGTGNVVVWSKTYERQRTLIRGENLLALAGVVEREGLVVNVIARRFWPLDLEAPRRGRGRPPGERPRVAASSRDFR